jgi:4-hydroxythreonine-4-phosphate dehydrogenase
MRTTTFILADDLTGAADAGLGFRRAGLATAVTWTTEEVETALTERFDVVAVDTRTRAGGVEEATVRCARLADAIRAAGVPVLYKKIDSMLRGHVGPELRAVIGGWHPRAVAIVAPAFPAMRRTTVDGRQRVDNAPLSLPAIPAMLERSGVRTALVDLARVRTGPLSDTLSEFRDNGVGAIVCDAQTDEDLRAIALAGARLGNAVVWVGSAGLAAALPAALALSPAGAGVALDVAGMTPGPILVVVGSASAVARAQAAHFGARALERIPIPVAALDGSSPAAGASLRETLEECLRRSTDVLVTIGDDVAPDQENAALLDPLSELLRPCASLVSGLVVTGGETATRLLQAWGATGLQIVDEVETGVPLSITLGPRGLPVITKAGAFGQTATLTRAHSRLRAWLKEQDQRVRR